MKSKTALIDISADNSNSLGVKTDGMLLCGVEFPAAMTGSNITFDFSMDNSAFIDVVETDGTETTYTVSAGNILRVDPSGWAFASNGYIRVTSDGNEAADRKIVLHFRHS
ncbi:putative carboxypeptidase-related protein [uncultured Mediterranean phage uvMED]|nr:putative carboxypeptidase-related protein [uncultured Mediterranean phage uvMED]